MAGKTKTKDDANLVVAEYPGVDESTLITITLAHPLGARYFQAIGLPAPDGFEDEPLDTWPDLAVGTQIKVNRNAANSLISGGYGANIDPENKTLVAEVLGGDVSNVDQAGIESGPAGGNDTSGQSSPAGS